MLDSNGNLAHHFDAFTKPGAAQPQPGGIPNRRPRQRESLATYTRRQLQRAVRRLSVAERRRVRQSWDRHAIRLPDLESTSVTDAIAGVRVFVQLQDDRMKAYQAPVVEVVPLTPPDLSELSYPTRTREISAQKFKQWLRQIYPPGVMERTDPRTKKVYEIQSTTGTLRLSPAGADSDSRYAVLRGDVTLTDEGSDAFSYRGELQVVVTYRAKELRPHSLRGTFEGDYPRKGRHPGQSRMLPLRAAIESLPIR